MSIKDFICDNKVACSFWAHATFELSCSILEQVEKPIIQNFWIDQKVQYANFAYCTQYGMR